MGVRERAEHVGRDLAVVLGRPGDARVRALSLFFAPGAVPRGSRMLTVFALQGLCEDVEAGILLSDQRLSILRRGR